MPRMITGTRAQMQGAQSILDALMALPNAAIGTTTWAVPELIDDGVTWGLRVPLKGLLVVVRARVQADGIDAVLAEVNARTGLSITKAQANNLLTAIQNATSFRTKAQADVDAAGGA